MMDNLVTKIKTLREFNDVFGVVDEGAPSYRLRTNPIIEPEPSKLKETYDAMNFVHLIKTCRKVVDSYNSDESRDDGGVLKVVDQIKTIVSSHIDPDFKTEVKHVENDVTIGIEVLPGIKSYHIKFIIPDHRRLILRTILNNKKRWRKYYV